MEFVFPEICLSGRWTSAAGQMGKDIFAKSRKALEEKLGEYIGAPYCVSVPSATAGLLLALKAAGVGEGDLVLCTGFSYFALTEVIRLAGASPVLVDIDSHTYTVDLFCLEYMIERCLRAGQPMPKALIAVDLFGLPCDYDALEAVCQKHGIALIEDMAHAFGASYRGRKAGSFGRMAAAAFFPAKPLGEEQTGGAVFCHTPEDALQLVSLRSRICSPIGCAEAAEVDLAAQRLELHDVETECRQEIAWHYTKRLGDVFRLQQVGEGVASACTHFTVSAGEQDDRDAIVRQLDELNIPCAVFAPPPLPQNEMMTNLPEELLVNTRTLAEKTFSLPIHPYLTLNVVDHICDALLAAVSHPVACTRV